MYCNLYDDISRAVPEKTAVVWDGRRFTYTELEERIEDFSSHLQAEGVSQGDRVGLVGLPKFDHLAAVYGCAKVGAVAVPASADDAARAQAAMRSAGACLVLREAPARRSRATHARHSAALIIFTSGTTSEARKGVILGHDGISSTSAFMNRAMGVDSSIVELVFAPLDHAFAFGRCHAVLMVGGTILLGKEASGFEPFFQALGSANGLSTVPSILASLLRISRKRLQDAGRELRWIQTGAMRFDRLFRDQLCETFPAARIFLHYGLSEAMRVTFMELQSNPRKRHTEGRPSDGVEIAIFDEDGNRLPPGKEGIIALRGRNLALGYVDEAMWREHVRDGWFVTADRGALDEDGYLVFAGRADDVINANGHIVHPDEIESRLHAVLRDRAFSVVGIPDPRGIKDKIIVLAVEGEPVEQDVIARAFAGAPDFMIPRVTMSVDRLPRTPSGKVMRTKLAAMLSSTVQVNGAG